MNSILERLAWPESLELLVEQLDRDDDDPAVNLALDALASLGAPGAERMVSEFARMPRRVQLQIPRTLERSGGAPALRLASEVLAGPDLELAERFSGVPTYWPNEPMLDILAARASGESELLDSTLVRLDAVLEARNPLATALRAAFEDSELAEDAARSCPHCGHRLDPGEPPDVDHELADDTNEGEESAPDEDATDARMDVPAGDRWPAEPTSTTASPQGQPRVGRNDPCPCGSGKKFKRCCLA